MELQTLCLGKIVLFVFWMTLCSAFTSPTPQHEFTQRKSGVQEENDVQQERPERIWENDQKRRGLKRLAQLSLEDYQWRVGIFQEREADRKVEEYLSGMMGDDPSYVRPMDASNEQRGPLGEFEKKWVDWLYDVINEEARRAQKIVQRDGTLIRPIDNACDRTTLGPLGSIELAVVDFLARLRQSEKDRIQSGGLLVRPKDMGKNRGPLGDLEYSVFSALQTLSESEKMRLQQSQLRGGELVRPIDVPGPLGEFELAVAELINAEQQRVKGDGNYSLFLRPMDSNLKGPLGNFERQAVRLVQQLSAEEEQRLRNIRERIQQERPMESNKSSFLGQLETIVVGILRAPFMMFRVLDRVQELLLAQPLEATDQDILMQQQRKEQQKATYKNKPSDPSDTNRPAP